MAVGKLGRRGGFGSGGALGTAGTSAPAGFAFKLDGTGAPVNDGTGQPILIRIS